jgi:hypothetical protein
MKEKSLQRLLVFVPPRRSFGAKGHMSTGTVVSYVAPGSAAAAAETPLALLPKAAAVELVFDPADVFVTAIEPPKLSEGKLRLALPNLLEDRLLADANDCHFGFNIPRGGTGSTTTLLAPTRAPAPMVMGPRILAPQPTSTPSSSVGWRLPGDQDEPPSVTP